MRRLLFGLVFTMTLALGTWVVAAASTLGPEAYACSGCGTSSGDCPYVRLLPQQVSLLRPSSGAPRPGGRVSEEVWNARQTFRLGACTSCPPLVLSGAGAACTGISRQRRDGPCGHR